MSGDQCCDHVELAWTQRVVERQYADLCYCTGCGTVHLSERYPVPLKLFPLGETCVHCGGQMGQDLGQTLCSLCENTPEESLELLQHLAKIHPSGKLLDAALALQEMGRLTLAFKLASAEIAWGEDPVTARVLRLQVLEGLGLLEAALDEAYRWSHENPPSLIWGVLADLEGAAGNLDGVLRCLETGMHQDPENMVWATDYAEVMAGIDERPMAIRFAGKAILDPECEERCARVLAEVGERFYANGQFAEALGVCSIAKHCVDKYESICWLRARVCASQNQDLTQILTFLEQVLALNPDHEGAKRMLETFRPPTKKGWFSW